MENLTGKFALVTGSTDGVGRMVASQLARAGAEVVVHGRDADRGRQVVAKIEAGGGRAHFIAADLSEIGQVRALAQSVLQRTQRLDLLVNNAGIGSGGPDGKRQTNVTGQELRFTVNYLAGFVLRANCCRCCRRARRPGSSTSLRPANKKSISATSC